MNENILRIYKSSYVPWKFIFSADGKTEYASMQRISNMNKIFWELKMLNGPIEIYETMTEVLNVIEKRWKEC